MPSATAQPANPKTHDPHVVRFEHHDLVVMENPVQDDLMTAILALGMEVWALRRRMAITEKVLAAHHIPIEEIEGYMPDKAETEELTGQRDQFLRAVYGHIGRRGGKRPSDLVPPGYNDPAANAAAARDRTNAAVEKA